jgi:hypothetical protein
MTMLPFRHNNFTLSSHPTNNGFAIILPNTFVVSVRWGNMNYCSNRFNEYGTKGSETAEVAIFDPKDKIVGDVHGHVDPAMLLDLINQASNMKETK